MPLMSFYPIIYLIIGLAWCALNEFGLSAMRDSDDEETKMIAEMVDQLPVFHGVMATLNIVAWPLMILTTVFLSQKSSDN